MTNPKNALDWYERKQKERMTATEELRRLLDERGVEWEADDAQVDGNGTTYCVTYVKEGYGRTWVYEEPPNCDLLISYDHDLGVEDAIDATLGRGECHDDNSRFNAWRCSECRATVLLMFDDYGEPSYSVDGVADVPKYCPNCGRRVTE